MLNVVSGYGMLLISPFLFQLCELWGSDHLCSILYCDNLGLVQKITSRLQFWEWYPKETISNFFGLGRSPKYWPQLGYFLPN